MNIDKKFNMLSTKEWIQYLQFKLTPEREKELEESGTKDPFLQEALNAIRSQEHRPIAFQSISMLISTIQENTGVSESRIAKGSTVSNYATPTNINYKKIGLIIAGVALCLGIGYGIYYLINNTNFMASTEDIATPVIDSASITTSNYADSSSRPFDVIPNTASTMPIDSALSPTSPNTAAAVSKPTSTTPTKPKSTTPKPQTTESTPATILNNSNNGSKEREQFERAQDLYKQNKTEEAKKILNELKSYDNPMKSNSEAILKHLGGN